MGGPGGNVHVGARLASVLGHVIAKAGRPHQLTFAVKAPKARLVKPASRCGGEGGGGMSMHHKSPKQQKKKKCGQETTGLTVTPSPLFGSDFIRVASHKGKLGVGQDGLGAFLAAAQRGSERLAPPPTRVDLGWDRRGNRRLNHRKDATATSCDEYGRWKSAIGRQALCSLDNYHPPTQTHTKGKNKFQTSSNRARARAGFASAAGAAPSPCAPPVTALARTATLAVARAPICACKSVSKRAE